MQLDHHHSFLHQRQSCDARGIRFVRASSYGDDDVDVCDSSRSVVVVVVVDGRIRHAVNGAGPGRPGLISPGRTTTR